MPKIKIILIWYSKIKPQWNQHINTKTNDPNTCKTARIYARKRENKTRTQNREKFNSTQSRYENVWGIRMEYSVKNDYRPLTLSPSTAMELLIIIKVGNMQRFFLLIQKGWARRKVVDIGLFHECYNCVQVSHKYPMAHNDSLYQYKNVIDQSKLRVFLWFNFFWVDNRPTHFASLTKVD